MSLCSVCGVPTLSTITGYQVPLVPLLTCTLIASSAVPLKLFAVTLSPSRVILSTVADPLTSNTPSIVVLFNVVDPSTLRLSEI